jgi:3-phenylpropionate/trans-cinnamate dioxygenase ferredoxin subunit
VETRGGTAVGVFGQDELAPGEVRAVRVGRTGVVVIRKRDGSFRALRDRCPHQAARLSEGPLRPMVVSPGPGDYAISEDREILHCPWHSYEFDVDDGISPTDPKKLRVASYPVTVVDGVVTVHMKGRAAE